MMQENKYSRNMRFKTDAELQEILAEKSKYNNEAIQAVIYELENRNLLDDEAKKALNFEPFLEEETSQNIKEVANSTDSSESKFDEFEPPILYSKNAIRGFSIFFSTIFGAVLLMSNLKKMDKPKARIDVLIFGIVYLLGTYSIIYFTKPSFGLTLIINIIGYVILTEFFWNKHLGSDLQIQKKSIQKPLIISLSILAVILFFQFLPHFLT